MCVSPCMQLCVDPNSATKHFILFITIIYYNHVADLTHVANMKHNRKRYYFYCSFHSYLYEQRTTFTFQSIASHHLCVSCTVSFQLFLLYCHCIWSLVWLNRLRKQFCNAYTNRNSRARRKQTGWPSTCLVVEVKLLSYHLLFSMLPFHPPPESPLYMD